MMQAAPRLPDIASTAAGFVLGAAVGAMACAHACGQAPDGWMIGLMAALLFQQFLHHRRVGRLARLHADEAALRRLAQQRTYAIADNLPARISQFDRQERVLFANRFCGEVYGCEPGALVGRTILDVRGARDHAAIKPYIDRALRGEHVRFENAMERDGQTRHFRQDYVPDLAPDGNVRGFYSISFEITDFRRAEAALGASERRLRDITNNLPALIAYIDTDERLQFANRTFEEWSGKSIEWAIGRHITEIWTGAQSEVRLARLQQALAGETVSFEAMLGPDRHTQVTYMPDLRDGRVLGAYALVNDITAMKRVERELDRLAHIDPLTGLPNRREIDARLAEEIARCDASGDAMAVMFLDIDRFKMINDTHGHAVGDAVLREVGRRLRETVPAGHLVARLAGDEFVVILAPLAGLEPGVLAEAARLAIRRPGGGGDPAVSSSIGIAIYEGGGASASELLACADEALYEAKAAGRDTWRSAVVESPQALA